MAIKLFFFDMEGTLYNQRGHDIAANGSLWHKIALSLGERAIKEDDRLYQKYEGKGKYFEWIAACMKMYKEEGLRQEQFSEIVHSMKLNDGVEETIAALHKKGIITALISGGFMAAAGKVQQQLRIRHALAATKIFWKDGKVDHWNLLPANDMGKVDFVELLRREYGFAKEECAFVGDGRNDLHIAEHVGVSFAYQAHPQLKEKATHVIEDFRDILKHV